MAGRHNANNINHGMCPATGKLRYPTRKDAKRSADSRHSNDAAYPCEHGDHWHLGRLPDAVVRGSAGRDDIVRLRDDPGSAYARTRELVERYRAGRTLLQLSTAKGGAVSLHSWRAWTRGRERIPVDLVEVVAEILGAPVDEVRDVAHRHH
jgi:hypothetical protein